MEDGDNKYTKVLSKINTDDKSRDESHLPIMANYPDIEVTVIKNKNSTEAATATNTKVNGESAQSQGELANTDEDDENSTDEDALVIDEEKRSHTVSASLTNRKRLLSPSSRIDFKGFKKKMLRRSVEVFKSVNEYLLAAQLQESDMEKELKTNEAKCDNTDESNSQGELDSIEANTKNMTDDTELAKSGYNETPVSVSNAHMCNVNQIPVDAINEDHDSTQINPPDPTTKPRQLTINNLKMSGKKTNKKSPSPKLTEYAQYLGLQPTVKFKCYKCSDSSFPSMNALKEHQQQCLVQRELPAAKPAPPAEPNPENGASTAPAPPSAPAPQPSSSSTNFRVTRKVFLCSACGTYYENWNLFLHMREVHRRFICLYCLGMFSLVERLSQHLITKHNCTPTQYLSAEEYLSTCKEACFLMCCHCERVFTEQDNFFDHVCTEKATTKSDKACWSCGMKGTTPHLPSCKASLESPSTSNQKTNKILTQKITNQKQIKSTKKTPFANIEHVTADSPSNSKPLSPRLESEQTCDIANLCTVDMDSTALNSEPTSPSRTPGERSPPGAEQEREEQNRTEAEQVEAEPVREREQESPRPEEESPVREGMAEDAEPTTKPTENTEREDTPDLSEPAEMSECENNQPTSEPEYEKMESDNENIHSDSKTPEPPDSNEPVENIDNEVQSEQESDKDAESNHSFSIETKTNETNKPVRDSENSSEMPMDVSDTDRNQNVSETEMDIDTSEIEHKIEEHIEEVRRVPKVTLKLPPPGTRFSDNESDDSEKLTMEVEENEESEQDQEFEETQEDTSKETEQKVNGIEHEEGKSPSPDREIDGNPIAGDDVSIVELELEQPLDKFTTENLIKTCLGATVATCIYCNHARKISVNGKQLGLHAIAEHRFSATVNSITAEELIPYNFVMRIRDGLNELDEKYFNLELTEEEKYDQPSDITFKREYECFQCRYVATIHKELYLHNRKMHAKTILLCIICKSNFYSYSELICHLCPGNYVLNNDMKFRCCMCDIPDLPSAFRLMVHLRKKHHTCDVCLEGCQNQSRLSNHVWKHKLHHLCYRCGIAYRNKPDITKHLFWKHGTESVLCKKCLQKKWPHVYHFCIPPTAFVCEECNLSFSRAVYLKVHKRLHSSEKKHACNEEGCTEIFISKKLLLKHEKRHREPEPIPEKPEVMNGDLTLESEPVKPVSLEKEILNENKEIIEEKPEEDDDKKQKMPDIYDLPALNLSESDSDDSEDEAPKSASIEEVPKEEKIIESVESPEIAPNPDQTDEEQKPVQVVDGIWDNFKQYQATIEKRDSIVDNKDTEDREIVKEVEEDVKEEKPAEEPVETETKVEIKQEPQPDLEVIMIDHDYCVLSQTDEVKKEETSEMDHDYCSMSRTEGLTQTVTKQEDEKKKKSKKKNSSSSDSSSDSDSSSCTCGSNCSCSSSSGSSSSSSSSSDSDSTSSEGKRRIAARKERRKERAKRKKESETSQATNTSAVDVVATEDNPSPPIIDLPIEESDLDTDETETDEDFYDEHPQRLANKMLEEKRNQLMLLAGVAPPVNNGSIVECSRPSTPSIPDEAPPKKKLKSKKRKKKSKNSTPKQEVHIPTYNHQQSPLLIQNPVPPPPQVIHRPVIPSPVHTPPALPPTPRPVETPKQIPTTGSGSETDSNVRSSKRRRVPNKFYGYSSDDEASEKPPAPPILKWRRADLPSTPTHVAASPKYVPPITIKTIPSPAPVIEPVQAPIIHHQVQDSDSEADVQQRKSSSDSSDERNDDSDSDGQLHISQPQFPTIPVTQVQRTNENLYCYCQCPYDEVSEMIACDGRDCAIEWFHFECVGIMVPPKGKWFCPDCRKKSTLRNDFVQT